MKNSIFLLIAILSLIGCSPSSNSNNGAYKAATMGAVGFSKDTKTKRAKNIIFLIGDGMGISQVSAAAIKNNNKLHIMQFPVIGIHNPQPVEGLITDSAAGATAFAAGVKTFNGAIGVTADSTPVETILEECEKIGMATGLVATSTIVHATPASFIAHRPSRKQYEEIASDFMNTEIDYFVGGGKKYFDRRSKDDRNLVEEMQKKGYVVEDYFKTDFDDIKIDSKQNFAYFTADDDPIPFSKGRDYLFNASKAGIEFLNQHDDPSDSNGFFLMIEGSQIDWGGHANDADYVISELLEFDNVIGEALRFAKQDGETLVLVTADHETGGMAINSGSTVDSLNISFSSGYHTADLIPVYAYGPGSELFSGFYENTEIYHKLRSVLGLDQ
jgi:alkaline phosphatase